MIESIILLLQVLLWPLCLGIVGLILLQGGAGDLSSAFGGGGALDSTLGVGASKKMAKVTGWMAGLFFVFVLFLAIPNKGGLGSPSKSDHKGSSATSANSAPVPGTAPATAKPAQPVTATSAPVLTPAAPVSTPVIAIPNDSAKQAVEKVVEKVEAVVAPVMAPAAPVVPVEIKPADAAPAAKPAQ